MQNSDYLNVTLAQQTTQREGQKNSKFKKNAGKSNQAQERGYGKAKYSNKSSGGSSLGQHNLGLQPHSLLEKEIRQIMNESSIAKSAKENNNEMSFLQESNLRQIQNQRQSAMSNYQQYSLNKGVTQSQRGSHSIVNNRGGSQVLRQGKKNNR